MKILCATFHDEFPAWSFPDWCADELREKFPSFDVVKLPSPDRVLQEIPDSDVFLTFRMTPEYVQAARKLKWIHTGMAGLTWILIPEVVNSDIIVSNSRGVHAIPIAEHTMALMLQFSRRLARCLEDQQKAIWRRREIFESRISF